MLASDLRYSSQHFDHLTQGICAIAVCDRQIQYCNAVFQREVNLSKEQLLHQDISVILGTQWVPCSEDIETMRTTNTPFCQEVNVVSTTAGTKSSQTKFSVTYSYGMGSSRDEEYLIISTSPCETAQPVRLTTPPYLKQQQGSLSAAGGTIISKVRLMEMYEELEESRQNLLSAFEAGNLGSCGVNFVTGEVTMSDRARLFFGLPEVGDVTWDDLLVAVDPAYHDMVNKAFSDSLTHGAPVDSTYPIIHLITGRRRWVRVVAKVHFDIENKPLKVFGIIMDVTIQKTEEQRKNDFISIISHELRTPITSIMAITQMVQRKLHNYDDEQVNNLLTKSTKQTDKMAKLIDSFLNIAKLEDGKIELHREKFDLTSLLEDVLEELRLINPQNEIVLSAPKEAHIVADKYKIGQVLTNLVGNAVKYSPKNQKIAVYLFTKGGDITVQVKDWGIGLSESELPHVFDRFYRANNKSAENISGFGVGLFICREIIEMHQGTIWAESVKDKESTFSFRIPRQ